MVYCLLADLFVLPAQILVGGAIAAEPDPLLLDCGGRTVVACGYGDGSDLVLTGLCEGPDGVSDLNKFRRVSSLGHQGEIVSMHPLSRWRIRCTWK